MAVKGFAIRTMAAMTARSACIDVLLGQPLSGRRTENARPPSSLSVSFRLHPRFLSV